MTTLKTDLNDFDKKLHLFDVMCHGVYDFQTVLNHHKANAEFENAVVYGLPAMDGVVFLCDHPNLETLNRRIKEHNEQINELTEAMNGLRYNVSRYLDSARYRLKCRLQLLCLCRENYWIKQAELNKQLETA